MAALRDAARHPAATAVPLLREHHVEHEHDDEHDDDYEHDYDHGHGHDHDHDAQQLEETKPHLQARLRLYWLATVLCCGALLFGYDSGLIG